MYRQYKALSKEEKKEMVKSYNTSVKGKAMSFRLLKLIIEGSLLYGIAAIIIISSLFTKEFEAWMGWLTALCILAGTIFLLGQHMIRMKEYDEYLEYEYKLKKKLTKRK